MNNRMVKPLIVAGLCLMVSGCGTRTYKEVPHEVTGVWKTTAAKYADRYFELKKDSVVFGQGGSTRTTYSVVKVIVTDEKQQARYKIEYLGSEGQTENWEFTYDRDTTVLRLNSQGLIGWRKAG